MSYPFCTAGRGEAHKVKVIQKCCVIPRNGMWPGIWAQIWGTIEVEEQVNFVLPLSCVICRGVLWWNPDSIPSNSNKSPSFTWTRIFILDAFLQALALGSKWLCDNLSSFPKANVLYAVRFPDKCPKPWRAHTQKSSETKWQRKRPQPVFVYMTSSAYPMMLGCIGLTMLLSL